MSGFHCLNDFFNYCNGTPKAGEKPTELLIGLGNGCIHDPKTCRHFVSAKDKDTNVKKNTAS